MAHYGTWPWFLFALVLVCRQWYTHRNRFRMPSTQQSTCKNNCAATTAMQHKINEYPRSRSTHLCLWSGATHNQSMVHMLALWPLDDCVFLTHNMNDGTNNHQYYSHPSYAHNRGAHIICRYVFSHLLHDSNDDYVDLSITRTMLLWYYDTQRCRICWIYYATLQ